jgi:hypothetical protein
MRNVKLDSLKICQNGRFITIHYDSLRFHGNELSINVQVLQKHINKTFKEIELQGQKKLRYREKSLMIRSYIHLF